MGPARIPHLLIQQTCYHGYIVGGKFANIVFADVSSGFAVNLSQAIQNLQTGVQALMSRTPIG
jgi:hypothetical protein